MHCTRFASSPLRTGQLPNAISRRQTAAPAGSKQQGSPEREGPAAALSEPDPVHASRAACGSAAIETFLCIWAGRHYIFLKISLSSILLHALVHTPPGHFKQHDGQGLGRCTEMGPVKRTTVGGCGAGGGSALICRFLMGTGAGGGRLSEPPSCAQAGNHQR
jgi:hypothetical protein